MAWGGHTSHATFKTMQQKALIEVIQLLPVARALILMAQLDAPNYRPASSLNRCASCRHFVRGALCDLYDFNADPDYICSSWQARNPDLGEER